MDAAHNLMQFINNFVLTDLSKNYEGLYNRLYILQFARAAIRFFSKIIRTRNN